MGNLARFALFIGAAVPFAGCGGSQPAIGGQGVVPLAAQSGVYGARASNYRVLYSFKNRSDGNHPLAGLVDVNGMLYGTTVGGGSAGKGTVYRVSTDGREKVLHSFGHGTDGAGPWSELIDVDGTLYGTTIGGGASRNGTVYSISTTGAEKVLHSFSGGSDGARPQAALVNVDHVLYGTTSAGGGKKACGFVGCGTVYQISTTGSEKVLYAFNGGSQGADLPESSLLKANGTLYGTTWLGGSSRCSYGAGCGTIFSVTMDGTEKLLYRFKGGADGENPFAGLINVNGLLYGTTTCGGGQLDCGTVYAINADGVERVLHRFKVRAPSGWSPETELLYVGGTFYGTTDSGGSHGDFGTVYSMGASGVLKVLHNFAGGSDGLYPEGKLIDVNGTLYGTTYYDGGGGKGTCCGTVFALTL